jgi:hypothetical protein
MMSLFLSNEITIENSNAFMLVPDDTITSKSTSFLYIYEPNPEINWYGVNNGVSYSKIVFYAVTGFLSCSQNTDTLFATYLRCCTDDLGCRAYIRKLLFAEVQ